MDLFKYKGSVKTGSNLVSGMRYDFEIIGGDVKEKVVRKHDALPAAARGKLYKDLSDTLKAAVDGADIGTTKKGNVASKFYDEVTISAQEVTTGRKFFYDIKFYFWDGQLNAAFIDFVRKVTGKIIGAGDNLTVGDFLKPGDRFSAEVELGKDGWQHIKPDTVAATAATSFLDTLTDDEKALLKDLTPYTGRKLEEIKAYIEAGQVTKMGKKKALDALDKLSSTVFFEGGVFSTA